MKIDMKQLELMRSYYEAGFTKQETFDLLRSDYEDGHELWRALTFVYYYPSIKVAMRKLKRKFFHPGFTRTIL